MSTSDQIVAQLEKGGCVIAHVEATDIGSLGELLVMVKALAGKFLGLGRLTVRNKTQGWSQVIPLASRRCAAPAYSHRIGRSVSPGHQYVIPFAG